MTKHDPSSPYVIQSGKKTGKSIEQLMCADYSWLVYMKSLLNKKSTGGKNQMHKHIEWALSQGETRIPKKICPQCGTNPVAYFSVLGERRVGYSMNSVHTCCSDAECKKKLIAQGIEKTPTLLPIVFSSIAQFRLKHDQKQVMQILKQCFELPKRLTKDTLFAFFKE